MIINYHRPNTLEEALTLLARPDPLTLPLGGGIVLNAPSDEQFAVVDLQNLGLNTHEKRGNALMLGAAVTLQNLLDIPELPPALHAAVRHEATHNLRQAGTVAGTLVAADGRSPFAAAMLALDAKLTLLPGEEEAFLGDVLNTREGSTLNALPHRLITQIAVSAKAALAYQYVARSPADRPIVCVAVAKWPSGRVRVVVGGFGDTPRLALDGPQPGGEEHAVRSATANAADQWASAEYRQDVAVTLVKRCLKEVGIG